MCFYAFMDSILPLFLRQPLERQFRRLSVDPIDGISPSSSSTCLVHMTRVYANGSRDFRDARPSEEVMRSVSLPLPNQTITVCNAYNIKKQKKTKTKLTFVQSQQHF